MRVYKKKEIKVGRKKVRVWTVAFTPKKGTGQWAMDQEFGQCVKYVKENGGLDTNTNLLADNAYTQCPNCRTIFDHTKDDANKFEAARRLI
jgi:hypothetical protein